MTLETHIKLWRIEAIAHGYVGFLVIGIYHGYDRVFLHSADELEPARNSMRANNKCIVHEEML